jgi:predicted PurR-regulated permease PerM
LGVIFGWALVTLLFFRFFGAISTVLLGLLAVAILTSTLQPALRFIPGPRALAAVTLVFGSVGIVALLMYALSYPLAEPMRQRLQQLPQIQQDTNELLQRWNQRLGLLDHPLTVSDLLAQMADFLTGDVGKRLFSGTTDVLLGLSLSLALVVFGTIFCLTEPPDDVLGDGLRLLPDRRRSAARELLADLGPRYRRWVLGTVTGMCIVFTASVLGFSLIGVKVALALAIIAAIAEIVPTVGPAIAAVVLALITLATQSGGKALGVLGVYGIIQAFEAYLILPVIMRGAVQIHPAVTLFTVVLWGKVFGVPGLMLAIPLNLTIWRAVQHFYIIPRDAARKAQSQPAPPDEVVAQASV